ncbi:hypothetical protein [Streptomyces sp. NPDC006355]|uniref:hypothetical protein n=1 Tax=Streptomyces sp. NPDC006355 TaxID=3156758 RepID=UPI0033A4ECBA
MTTPETEPSTPDAEDEFQRLSKQLLRTAKSAAARAAVQALLEERTVLKMPAVRQALILHTDDGEMAHFEGLAGHQYSLGLDKEQRCFLELVLSMLGFGVVTLAAAQNLDDQRLAITLRAILRLAGNEDLAVGRRL